MKNGIFILLLLFGSILSFAQTPIEADSTQPVLPDSISTTVLRRYIPFVDSLLTDSLKTWLYRRIEFVPIQKYSGRVVDPYDPYNHENYVRKGLGKFWFFFVTLLIAGLILYFRNAFPSQLALRIRSLFNGYYFRELISEFGISFTSGSVVAAIISTLIMAQAFVVVVVYSGYVNLNSLIFYIIVVLMVVIWKVLLYWLQRLQAYVLDLWEVSRNQTQRQINIDFGISMLLFPLLLVAYFNASRLAAWDMGLVVSTAITMWFALRIILEFIGLFRETGFSLSGILYFCGFEILPHAVLLTALFRIYKP